MRRAMRAMRKTAKSRAMLDAPAPHAFVVVPWVGGVVMALVAVGIIATIVGAWSGILRPPRRGPPRGGDRNPPSPPR
jgi:Na+/glutamate symporter